MLESFDMGNKKYSMLMVGYQCYPGHVADFVRHLKKVNPAVEISLVTTYPLQYFPNDIVENTEHIYQIPFILKWKKIRKFLDWFNLVKTFAALSRKHRYDFVNIQFAMPFLAHAIPWIKRMTNHLIITPWGSDVFRVDKPEDIKAACKLYEAASRVMVDSESQLAKEVVHKFKCNPDKILSVPWGMEYVDFLLEEKPSDSEEESKARFGLEGRYVITCGYNARPVQRHEAIIDAVAKIKDKLPENLTLLFPFTYGWPHCDTYAQSLLDKCKNYGLTGMVIRDFLSYPDIYRLRNATDMFVHVQTTDASSSCVMQYILSNKKIVHGAWMKYNDLEAFQPLFYFPVQQLNDLADVILEAYRAESIDIPQGVFDTILSKGWGSKMPLFNNYCESVLQ